MSSITLSPDFKQQLCANSSDVKQLLDQNAADDGMRKPADDKRSKGNQQPPAHQFDNEPIDAMIPKRKRETHKNLTRTLSRLGPGIHTANKWRHLKYKKAEQNIKLR